MKSFRSKDRRLIYDSYKLTIKDKFRIATKIFFSTLLLIVGVSNPETSNLLLNYISNLQFFLGEGFNIKSSQSFISFLDVIYDIFISTNIFMLIIYVYIFTPEIISYIINLGENSKQIWRRTCTFLNQNKVKKMIILLSIVLLVILWEYVQSINSIIIFLVLYIVLCFYILSFKAMLPLSILVLNIMFLNDINYVRELFGLIFFISFLSLIAFELTKFLFLLDFKEAFKEKNIIKEQAIEQKLSVLDLKTKLTNLVIRRNNYNFYYSLFICLVFVFVLGILSIDEVYTFKGLIKNEKEAVIKTYIIFSIGIIFIRFISRAIEIGLAFYYDVIKNQTNGRNTFLNGTNRTVLAIYSILELAILSGYIYLQNTIYINQEFLISANVFTFSSLLYMLILSIMKAVAVNIFNISYNGDIIFIGLRNLINYFVHIVQVIISVILITLSVANYINLPRTNTRYAISYEDGKYIILKFFVLTQSSTCTKLYESNELSEIKNEIDNMFEKEKITEDVYLELFGEFNYYMKF